MKYVFAFVICSFSISITINLSYLTVPSADPFVVFLEHPPSITIRSPVSYPDQETSCDIFAFLILPLLDLNYWCGSLSHFCMFARFSIAGSRSTSQSESNCLEIEGVNLGVPLGCDLCRLSCWSYLLHRIVSPVPVNERRGAEITSKRNFSSFEDTKWHIGTRL